MLPVENGSEVARVRETIRLQHEAAQRGLTGYAVVSRHDFINAKMERMDEEFGQLVALVGEQEAAHILAQTVWSKEEIEAASRPLQGAI